MVDAILALAGTDGASMGSSIYPEKATRALFRVVALDFTSPTTAESLTVELWGMTRGEWNRRYAGIAGDLRLRAVALGPIVVAVRLLG